MGVQLKEEDKGEDRPRQAKQPGRRQTEGAEAAVLSPAGHTGWISLAGAQPEHPTLPFRILCPPTLPVPGGNPGPIRLAWD